MAKNYQRTDLRQRQIAEAALAVIAEHGLSAFTTRAVAARLEIADGTIFRHFRNKTEIVLAALNRLEEELFTDFAADGDPLDRLAQIFRQRAALLGGPNAIGRLVFSDDLLHAGGEAARERIVVWHRRSLDFIGGALMQLAAEGRLRPDVEIPNIVRFFVGAMASFSIERSAYGGAIADLDAKIDAAWKTFETIFLQR